MLHVVVLPTHTECVVGMAQAIKVYTQLSQAGNAQKTSVVMHRSRHRADAAVHRRREDSRHPTQKKEALLRLQLRTTIAVTLHSVL
jgi:hypothetical protein